MTKYLLIGTGILLVLFGVYFKYSQDRLSSLAEAMALQKVTISEQEKTIKKNQEDSNKINTIHGNLSELSSKNSQQGIKNLLELDRAISSEDQDRINLLQKYRNRCFEIISGSPVQKEDQPNDVCPQVVKRYE